MVLGGFWSDGTCMASGLERGIGRAFSFFLSFGWALSVSCSFGVRLVHIYACEHEARRRLGGARCIWTKVRCYTISPTSRCRVLRYIIHILILILILMC